MENHQCTRNIPTIKLNIENKKKHKEKERVCDYLLSICTTAKNDALVRIVTIGS